MNLILLALSIISAINAVVGAPAVSSVHVSFVSGNKATQYSHGSEGDGKLVQYNLIDKGIGPHLVKRRSLKGRPEPGDPGELMRGRTRMTTTYEPPTTILTPTSTMMYRTDMTTEIDASLIPTTTATLSLAKKSAKKRVRFIMGGHVSTNSLPIPSASSSINTPDKPVLKTGPRLDSQFQATDDNLKPKDTKAVKRSPFLGDNFVGSFNFPDFDDFGGNDFGSLGNFGSGSAGVGTQRQSYSTRNPEALSPGGVFLPPLPTEASHYVEREIDPYLADPETAKYAAQHPPFFSEFPHKRTVLALNDIREDNGLERNILRSIRPFFPFFEANNRRHIVHHGSSIVPLRHTHEQQHHTPTYFFTDLDPTVIYYAEQHILPRVDTDPWSIFNVKR